MTDENLALLRTHRNNINRYRRLLKTKLTECERQFIEKRLSEEQSAVERLAASTFPLTFGIPMKAMERGPIETTNGRG
jgi:U3 small nucleolar ribonucleoprotein component